MNAIRWCAWLMQTDKCNMRMCLTNVNTFFSHGIQYISVPYWRNIHRYPWIRQYTIVYKYNTHYTGIAVLCNVCKGIPVLWLGWYRTILEIVNIFCLQVPVFKGIPDMMEKMGFLIDTKGRKSLTDAFLLTIWRMQNEFISPGAW